MELLANPGLISLALFAFANQALIPAPTDLIMLGLIKLGFNPLGVTLAVIIGQTLGAVFDYFTGRIGIEVFPWLRRRRETKGYQRAVRFYNRYGLWTLLVTFLPFVGKYFPLVAGVLETPVSKVIGLYLLGKVIYYGFWYFLIFSLR